MPACHCKDFSRAALLRSGAATAGRGLRAIEAGHAAARRHRPQPPLVPRPLERARAGRLRRRARSRPRAFEDGHRGRRRPPAPSPCSSRSSCRAALDSLSLLAPVGDSRYAALRADARARRRAATPRDVFTEDAGCAGTRTPRRSATCTAPARSDRDPGDRLRRPEPVALHLAPLLGGRRASTRRAASAGSGRYLDRHGAADNPLQGLSLDYTLAPALADADVPVAAVSSPEAYDALDARRLGRRDCSTPPVTRWGAQGALATADPELRRARRAARHDASRCAASSPACRATPAPGRPRSPTRREQRLRAAARRRSPRCSSMGLPLQRRRARRQRRLRHAREPGRDAAGQPRRCCRASLAAFQADLEARGLADRVLCTSGASSAAGRRRTARAPTTAPAALSLLIGHAGARARWSASSPAWRRSTRDGNLRHTVDFRARLQARSRAVARGRRRRGSCPKAEQFATPVLVKP